MSRPLSPAAAFRAYDIRGLVPDQLDPQLLHSVGGALAAEAQARGCARIAVGRDGRVSSPALHAALCAGLSHGGMQVVDVGLVPTPVLYYAAHTLADGSGAMVTGSHNPPRYNGVKLLLGGESLAGEAITALYRRIVDGNLAHGAGGIRQQPVLEEYIDRIAGDIVVGRPLRLVIDCGSGAAGVVAPQLFRRLGCEVSELFCEVDGTFPFHEPDPSQPENLQALREAVLEQGADLGVAFDGDGDRLVVVDGEGQIVWPDRLLMLFAQDLLQRHPGAAVMYDVKCSGKLYGLIRAAGGTPIMCGTGHSPIKAAMARNGALLAGELSGHLFFAERWYGFDDGLYAAARLLEILARDVRPARELLAACPQALATPELRIPMAEGEQQALMCRLGERLELFSDGQVSTIDGIRVDYEDAWGLVRASNTTPNLILRFEADTPAALARIEQRFKALLLSLEPQLQIPF